MVTQPVKTKKRTQIHRQGPVGVMCNQVKPQIDLCGYLLSDGQYSTKIKIHGIEHAKRDALDLSTSCNFL
jgi:hypothetical protein